MANAALERKQLPSVAILHFLWHLISFFGCHNKKIGNYRVKKLEQLGSARFFINRSFPRFSPSETGNFDLSKNRADPSRSNISFPLIAQVFGLLVVHFNQK